MRPSIRFQQKTPDMLFNTSMTHKKSRFKSLETFSDFSLFHVTLRIYLCSTICNVTVMKRFSNATIQLQSDNSVMCHCSVTFHDFSNISIKC